MQRRTGKSAAHISAPLPPSRTGSPSEKPTSRLNQKSLGVTNRIWLILILFVALILFTRSVLPHDNQASRRRQLNADLKPKNYLNITAGDTTVPFPFCPSLGAGDEIAAKYDPISLMKTRFHTGSGARVQRVINRAMSGYPVTMSIVGGSISACHGAGNDPLSPTCYPSRFFTWWNEVFPHPASELTNGAMRRTSSPYFSFCQAHHVPDITDLVIVELDSDDTADADTLENFERLIRALLIRPDQPAVIILGHFSPQIQDQNGYLGPDHWHNVVAQFYDVPYLTSKPLLYNHYMTDPNYVLRKYYADPVLANPTGHGMLADVLISYFQSRICAAWASAVGTSHETILGPGVPTLEDGKPSFDIKNLFGGVGQRIGAAGAGAFEPVLNANPEDAKANAKPAENKQPENAVPGLKDAPSSNIMYPLLRVPPTRINDRPSSESPREIQPFCVSANDLVNPLPSSVFSGSGAGWSVYHPPPGSAELSSHAHYWYSTLPTSRLRVGIQVGNGDIGIYFMKEPVAAPDGTGVGVGSAVECWVDDNYQGAVVIENAAYIAEPVPTLVMIDHNVGEGSHFAECQLMGEEDDRGVAPFKIIGIFAS